MKKIIKNICILSIFICCTSCSADSEHTIRENSLTVVGEDIYKGSKYKDDLSIYTLQYNNCVPSGWGSQQTKIFLIFDRNAFEVGDKLKIIKVEK